MNLCGIKNYKYWNWKFIVIGWKTLTMKPDEIAISISIWEAIILQTLVLKCQEYRIAKVLRKLCLIYANVALWNDKLKCAN